VQDAPLTPDAARRVALEFLDTILKRDDARDEVRVVAAKQLLDYSMNAPAFLNELDCLPRDAALRVGALIRRAVVTALCAALDRPDAARRILERGTQPTRDAPAGAGGRVISPSSKICRELE
jgi:hypothetical protein